VATHLACLKSNDYTYIFTVEGQTDFFFCILVAPGMIGTRLNLRTKATKLTQPIRLPFADTPADILAGLDEFLKAVTAYTAVPHAEVHAVPAAPSVPAVAAQPAAVQPAAVPTTKTGMVRPHASAPELCLSPLDCFLLRIALYALHWKTRCTSPFVCFKAMLAPGSTTAVNRCPPTPGWLTSAAALQVISGIQTASAIVALGVMRAAELASRGIERGAQMAVDHSKPNQVPSQISPSMKAK
jgi:hypothetical protein